MTNRSPFAFIRMGEYNPAWFTEGFAWGAISRKLLLAAIGLRCYRTHEHLIQEQANNKRLKYVCAHRDDGCSFKLIFTHPRTGWTTKTVEAHSSDCASSTLSAAQIQSRWLGSDSLIPALVLADVCRPLLVAQGRPIDKVEPKEVAKILKQLQLLPPLWETRPNSGIWLNSLAFVVTRHLRKAAWQLFAPSDSSAFSQIGRPTSSTEQFELDYLESFQRHYNSIDPDNQLLIIKAGEADQQQYVAAYMIVGPVKRMACSASSTLQFDLDGSHFLHGKRQLKCNGFLRAMVYTCGDGRIFPFMIGHESREESEEAYNDMLRIFVGCFSEEQLGNIGLASDRDKGIIASMSNQPDALKQGWTFCYAHLKRNVKDKFSDKKELAVGLLQGIALSTTIHESDAARRQAESELPDLPRYLSSIEEKMYVKAKFPRQRLGMTTNSVESFWAGLGSEQIREEVNVASMFGRIYAAAISKLQRAEADKRFFKDVLTSFASLVLGERGKALDRLGIVSIDGWSGTVRCSDSQQSYTCNLRTLECPCQQRLVHSLACGHLLKLADYYQATVNAPRIMTAPCFHQSNWQRALNESKPWNPITASMTENDRANSFRPAVYSKPKGRPEVDEVQRKHSRKSRSSKSAYNKHMNLDQQEIRDLSAEEFFASLPAPRQASPQSNGWPTYCMDIPKDVEFPPYIDLSGVKSLKPRCWLTDSIVYWGLLQAAKGRKDVLVLDTFFLQLCRRSDYRIRINRNHQLVLIPVHYSGNHWSLVVVYPKLLQIVVLDSFAQRLEEPVDQIRRAFERVLPASKRKWDALHPTVPQQTNLYDCGIFSIVYAEFVLAKSAAPRNDEFFSEEEKQAISTAVITKRERLWNAIFEASKRNLQPTSEQTHDDSGPSRRSKRNRPEKSSSKLPRQARPRVNRRIPSRGERN